MDGEDRITTLKEQRLYNGLDEDENIPLKEPFMFSFQLQRHYEMFYVEAVDNKKMTVCLLRSRSEAIFEEWSNLVFACCVNCFNC